MHHCPKLEKHAAWSSSQQPWSVVASFSVILLTLLVTGSSFSFSHTGDIFPLGSCKPQVSLPFPFDANLLTVYDANLFIVYKDLASYVKKGKGERMKFNLIDLG